MMAIIIWASKGLVSKPNLSHVLFLKLTLIHEQRGSYIWMDKHRIAFQTPVLVSVLLSKALNLSALSLFLWWLVIITLLPFLWDWKRSINGKVLFENWNTLDMCKKRSNSFQDAFPKEQSYLLLTRTLLKKTNSHQQFRGVLQRASLFPFQFKALEAANFQSKHSPLSLR